MDEATKQSLMTAIRQVLLASGAFAVGKGWISDEIVQAIVTLATIGIGAYAVYASNRKAKKADQREAVALNVGIALSNESPGYTPPIPKDEAKAVIATVTEGTKP